MKGIAAFNSISLEEIMDKSLLGRIDSKYIIRADDVEVLLYSALQDYDILEIDGQRNMYYQTIYYDKPSYDLYHHARIKRPNRFKIRYRKYHVNNLEFFELKEKVRGTSTLKHRVSLFDNSRELTIENFLDEHGKSYDDYHPSLDVRYKRICLVSKSSTERITIDTDFCVDDFSHEMNFENLAIIEVKSKRIASKNPVTAFLQTQNYHPVSCSKYCIGLAYVNKEIKKAGFAPQIRLINSILQ